MFLGFLKASMGIFCLDGPPLSVTGVSVVVWGEVSKGQDGSWRSFILGMKWREGMEGDGGPQIPSQLFFFLRQDRHVSHAS